MNKRKTFSEYYKPTILNISNVTDYLYIVFLDGTKLPFTWDITQPLYGVTLILINE